MTADSVLPEGWHIRFDSDGGIDLVQYRASLHQGHDMLCRLSVTYAGLHQDAAKRRLRDLAITWIQEHAQRTMPIAPECKSDGKAA